MKQLAKEKHFGERSHWGYAKEDGSAGISKRPGSVKRALKCCTQFNRPEPQQKISFTVHN
jgi:hypothetical protein